MADGRMGTMFKIHPPRPRCDGLFMALRADGLYLDSIYPALDVMVYLELDRRMGTTILNPSTLGLFMDLRADWALHLKWEPNCHPSGKYYIYIIVRYIERMLSCAAGYDDLSLFLSSLFSEDGWALYYKHTERQPLDAYCITLRADGLFFKWVPIGPDFFTQWRLRAFRGDRDNPVYLS